MAALIMAAAITIAAQRRVAGNLLPLIHTPLDSG